MGSSFCTQSHICLLFHLFPLFPFSLLFPYQQFSMALSSTMGKNKSFIASLLYTIVYCIRCMHTLDYICYVNKFNRMFSQTMMLFIYQLASCKWKPTSWYNFGMQKRMNRLREEEREKKFILVSH